MKSHRTSILAALLACLGLALHLNAGDSLTITRSVTISFPTTPGFTYQLQSSPEVANPTNWVDEGAPVTGTGNEYSVSVPVAGADRFYRLQTQGQPLLSPQIEDEINAHLEDEIKSYDIPGIIAGVKIGDSAPWITARGVADLKTQQPLGPDFRFRIGSASKTFVAMTVLALIHEGKLHFDDPVSKFLSATEMSALSHYNMTNITVRMLLRHTSGLQNYTDNIIHWFIPYIYDRTRVWNDLELLDLANEVGAPVSTPGTVWYYSNTNYVLLGLIVEKITGHWIGDEITSRWIDGLPLPDTVYPVPGESTIPGDKVAHGYMDWQNYVGELTLPSGLEDVTVYDPSGVGAAGPMISTCGDLLKWIYYIGHATPTLGDLNRGHLDWRYFRAMVVNGEVTDNSYGMGLAHEADPNNNANYYIVGHRGQISGYDTAMQYLPAQDTAIVVVCNRSLENGPSDEPAWPSNSNLVALNYIVGLLYPALIQSTQIPPSTAGVTAVGPAVLTTPRYSLVAPDLTLGERLAAKRDQIRWPLTEYP